MYGTRVCLNCQMLEYLLYLRHCLYCKNFICTDPIESMHVDKPNRENLNLISLPGHKHLNKEFMNLDQIFLKGFCNKMTVEEELFRHSNMQQLGIT